MITAIINQLKTGSVSEVIPFGQNAANPMQPYVVVWQDEPILQDSTEAGLNEYVINAHFPPGHINDLNDYIENEVYLLLNKQILITRDGRRVEVKVTGQIKRLVTGNDDNTISRERTCQTPAIYGGL
jgi:hypothetical protein